MLRAARQSAEETLARELGPRQSPDLALFLSGGNGTYLDALRSHLGISSQLDTVTVMRAVDALTRMPAETVAEALGMQLERAKVLPAGVAIAAAVVDYLRPASISAIPSGIVTGILTEETENHFAMR
jgi:exopolyphosphatase/pppGpp-phosphohydrolase